MRAALRSTADTEISSNPDLVLTLIKTAIAEGEAEDFPYRKLADLLNVSASYTTGIASNQIDELKVSDYVTFENWKKE